MKPTQILMLEHRVIEQVLSCAEKMAKQAEANGALNKVMAEKVLDFICNFSDHFHHGKEENHLFRMMEERGFSPVQGPVAVMRHEHDFGRNCVEQLQESLDGAVAARPDALTQFVEHTHALVEMLRSHIQKEDTKLYPMANSVFSKDDQDELLAAFHQVENQEMAPGTHAKYLALADELANFYGVSRSWPTLAEDCDTDDCNRGSCGGCAGH